MPLDSMRPRVAATFNMLTEAEVFALGPERDFPCQEYSMAGTRDMQTPITPATAERIADALRRGEI